MELREKIVCMVLREVRKQTSVDSREENINAQYMLKLRMLYWDGTSEFLV